MRKVTYTCKETSNMTWLRVRVCGAQSLPAPAQCLFLRLFQRKRHWFRISTLSYTEVPDMSDAVEALMAAGCARTSDNPSMPGLQYSVPICCCPG